MRRWYVFAILGALFVQSTHAAPTQEPECNSIHQIELEQHSGVSTPEEQPIAPPARAAPLTPTQKPLTKRVFGYNPFWVGTAYQNYNYDLLTIIGYFSYEVNPNTGGYTSIHDWLTTDLVKVAHSHGTRVVLVVTNFGYDNNDTLLTSAAQVTLVGNLVSLVKQRGADGVSVDFENVRGSQRNSLVNFMGNLAANFHSEIPGSEVSLFLPALQTNAFDAKTLSNVCDYLIMQGYDYHYGGFDSFGYYQGSDMAGAVAPLTGETLNVTNSAIAYLNAGVPASQLLLGVPYYGRDWPTLDGSKNSSVDKQDSGRGVKVPWYQEAKISAQAYGRQWDDLTKTPWYKYQQGGHWYQAWYDDTKLLQNQMRAK